MPRSWGVFWIVESDNAGDKLRRYDAKSGAIGNPTKDVRSSTAIALDHS